MERPHRTRNHIANEGVGQNRYNSYKNAIKRYHMAMEQGFYLEAVAIMESIIADRLESRLGELTQAEVTFGNLGSLREELLNAEEGALETNPILVKLYNKILSDWAGKRNKALHQIVKINNAEEKDWDNFLAESKIAAEEGMQYFRLLNKELSKERRNNSKQT